MRGSWSTAGICFGREIFPADANRFSGAVVQFDEQHVIDGKRVVGDAFELGAVANQHGEFALRGDESGQNFGLQIHLNLDRPKLHEQKHAGEQGHRYAHQREVGNESASEETPVEARFSVIGRSPGQASRCSSSREGAARAG